MSRTKTAAATPQNYTPAARALLRKLDNGSAAIVLHIALGLYHKQVSHIGPERLVPLAKLLSQPQRRASRTLGFPSDRAHRRVKSLGMRLAGGAR